MPKVQSGPRGMICAECGDPIDERIFCRRCGLGPYCVDCWAEHEADCEVDREDL